MSSLSEIMWRLERVWERSNRIPLLLMSGAIISIVTLADWWTKPFVAFGVLYLFPIMLAAGFLPRWIIVVADKAFKAIPELHETAERRVFAKRQARFDFHRGLHKEKAQGMWREAAADFKSAIRAPEDLGSRERHINASLFCSVLFVLTCLASMGNAIDIFDNGQLSTLMIRKSRATI